MFNLGICFEMGDGVEKSAEKAAELYTRAAELGDAQAMSELGLCYENGCGVKKSAKKAVEWYARGRAGVRDETYQRNHRRHNVHRRYPQACHRDLHRSARSRTARVCNSSHHRRGSARELDSHVGQVGVDHGGQAFL
jgi:hypothetical protein